VLQRPLLPLSFLACAIAAISLHAGSVGAQFASSEPDHDDVRLGDNGDTRIAADLVIRTAPLVMDGGTKLDRDDDPYIRVASAAGCDSVAFVERRFVAYLKAKNMDGVLSLYAPGAVFIQPDSTQVIGLDALRRLYVTTFATYDSDLSLDDPNSPESHAVPLGSTLCVHSGHYAEHLRTRKDGTVAHVHGTYSFTYKRTRDGRWLITRMRWSA
jgi:ketosteroid isomerase-like protein